MLLERDGITDGELEENTLGENVVDGNAVGINIGFEVILILGLNEVILEGIIVGMIVRVGIQDDGDIVAVFEGILVGYIVEGENEKAIVGLIVEVSEGRLEGENDETVDGT